ncbi:hypothetical protein N7474_001730 [Penicillium riverlandense]|uniref:uncharacterized protein n=1 Tax=Penicillium riverlandense TaxID=1903569 RepID=UPI00254945BB|nr:uncharacterized protein N7474_001730 [Penicillium riverlandense]KAJ5833419.1 hypothetical protein N7474_001730 [Penicillium riverlandense]
MRLGNETDHPQNPPAVRSCHSFRCYFPGCNANYRRKEHLHRHEAKHFQQQDFSCSNCGREFGRSDTLRRHVRQHHSLIVPLKRAQRACESCHAGKSRCEGGVPCDRCLRRKIQCSFNGRTGTADNQVPGSRTPRASSMEHAQTRFQHMEKTEQCINLYFETFHPCWSFVHKGGFDMRRETPLLVQSMVAIGLWASGGQPAQSAAVELHSNLNSAIRDQKEKWDASEVVEACSTCVWPIATYQAILLHIIFSFVLSSRGGIDIDLKISLSPADLGLLEALVRSCRRLGMFYYPNILARYKEDDLASFVWVGIEEIKRFNIALYKVCGKASRSSIRDGSQGNANAVSYALTALELQFPPPDSCPLWNAVGKDEWMAIVKDVKPVCLDDICQDNWISNFAGVLEHF